VVGDDSGLAGPLGGRCHLLLWWRFARFPVWILRSPRRRLRAPAGTTGPPGGTWPA